MAKAIQIVLSILGLVVAVFLTHSPQDITGNASKWKEYFPAWVYNPAIDRYIGWCLVIAIIIWWISQYAIKRKRKAFEIIYDLKNIGRQFREMKTIEGFSSHVTGIEYRVKIRNKTDRTLEDVKVKSEGLGLIGNLPIRLIFDETKQPTCTLDPNESAFVPLFFVPLPLFLPGTPMGRTFSRVEGPLRVTVSAKDTKAVEREFNFVPLTMQFDPFKESLII